MMNGREIPFSLNQPADVGGDIARIPASGGVEAFRTAAFSYGEDGGRNWRYAVLNPETQAWSVHEYHAVADTGVRSRTVFRTVCFFDALYACSVYQADRIEEGMGLVPLMYDDPAMAGSPEWTAVAKAAGQPVDLRGIVHPAAGGILLDGDATLGSDGVRTLAKSRDIALLPEAPKKQELVPVWADKASLPAAAGEAAPFGALVENLELKEAFQAAVATAEKCRVSEKYTYFPIMVKRMPSVIKNELNSDPRFVVFALFLGFAYGVVSVISFGAIPLLTGIGVYGLQYGISRGYLPKLRRQIEELPESRGKELLSDFAQDVEASLYKIHLIDIYNACRDDPRLFLEKSAPHFEKLAAVAGLADDDILRLQEEFLHGRFQTQEDICKALQNQYETVQVAVTGMFTDLTRDPVTLEAPSNTALPKPGR